jgi:hypothetical protein
LGISRINLKKYGSWAGILNSPMYIYNQALSLSFPLSLLSSLVVTGASEGIGRGYALEVGVLIINLLYYYNVNPAC